MSEAHPWRESGQKFQAYLHELFYAPTWIRQVNMQSLRADLIAGLTGATLVLPQGVAFAAIAGLPPEYGFYTAIVTAIVAAVFGSSLHAVSGPTTAISALVFVSLVGSFTPGTDSYIAAAITLAFLVGVYQLVLGVARLGGLVDFVSHSVMTGFMTGAALLIALSQVRHALGVEIPRPDELVEFTVGLYEQFPSINLYSLGIAALAFFIGIAVKKWKPLWPNYLIALMIATGISIYLSGQDANVATVGAIESVTPSFVLPDFSLSSLRDLSSAAIAIAMVGLLEAMSVSRAIGLKSGQMVDSNREFLGQGASNVVGSFFQCYPGSASFTRSGVNYDAGAQTPLSAVFAALFLFLILLLVAPWFAYVPIPAMAGVIILVAWRLIDIQEIKHIFTTSTSEAVIAGVTFFSAILINLEFAIYAGVLLSLGLFLNSTSKPSILVGVPDPESKRRVFKPAGQDQVDECPQLVIARLDGPLYFGSVEYLRRQFRRFEIERKDQLHMIFIVKGIGEIDMPGADLLIEEAQRRQRRGGTFHLQTKTPKMISKLARYKVIRELSREYIHLSKGDAIAEIVPTLDKSICATCHKRIFFECEAQPKPVPEEILEQMADATTDASTPTTLPAE
ncbi:MAG: SulP family inorganic anion transporter [Pseudomonadota bacterium]